MQAEQAEANKLIAQAQAEVRRAALALHVRARDDRITAHAIGERHTQQVEGAGRVIEIPDHPAGLDLVDRRHERDVMRERAHRASDLRGAIATDPEATFLLDQLRRTYARRLSLTQRAVTG